MLGKTHVKTPNLVFATLQSAPLDFKL